MGSYCNSVSAQITNSQNSEVKYQSNEQSSTDNSSLGSFNPLDLIHNANLRRSRDAGQFEEDTNTNLNQAADDFKRLQQQRMQNQSSDQVPPEN